MAEAARYVQVIVGDEADVLSRYRLAAAVTNADIIMRITADCPLISPDLCGEVLASLERGRADYSSNVEPRSFPKGLDCEAFTLDTLMRSPGPDEHVTTWMRTSPNVKRVNVLSPWHMDGRLTLDTEDDYKVICAAFGHEPYQHLRAG